MDVSNVKWSKWHVGGHRVISQWLMRVWFGKKSTMVGHWPRMACWCNVQTFLLIQTFLQTENRAVESIICCDMEIAFTYFNFRVAELGKFQNYVEKSGPARCFIGCRYLREEDWTFVNSQVTREEPRRCLCALW